jgi:hypothetical protein
MFKEHLIFPQVGLKENFAGEEEEGSFGAGIFMPEKMFLNELGDL